MVYDRTPLTLNNVLLAEDNNNSLHFPLVCITQGKTTKTKALLDCGASHTIISPKMVIKARMETKKLPQSRAIYNANKTNNSNGAVTHTTEIKFAMNGKIYTKKGYITNIGNEDLVLGLSWLQKHNPKIN